MRVEIAQIGTDAGQIEKNAQKIVTEINLAKNQGVDLVVFPELALPGYMSMDLFNNPGFWMLIKDI